MDIFPFLLEPPQCLQSCFFMVMIESTPWGPTKALHTVISDPQIKCLGQTLQAKEGQGFGTNSSEAGGTWQGRGFCLLFLSGKGCCSCLRPHRRNTLCATLIQGNAGHGIQEELWSCLMSIETFKNTFI